MMNPQQWQKVREVFDAAVAKRETDEIPSFLDDACLGDPELRREVESLLNMPKRRATFGLPI